MYIHTEKSKGKDASKSDKVIINGEERTFIPIEDEIASDPRKLLYYLGLGDLGDKELEDMTRDFGPVADEFLEKLKNRKSDD